MAQQGQSFFQRHSAIDINLVRRRKTEKEAK